MAQAANIIQDVLSYMAQNESNWDIPVCGGKYIFRALRKTLNLWTINNISAFFIKNGLYI